MNKPMDIDPPSSTSSTSSSPTSLFTLIPDPLLKVPHSKRLNVLRSFQEQYNRILESYLLTQPYLSTSLALEDELQLAKSYGQHASEYTRQAATSLIHLKRKPKVPFNAANVIKDRSFFNASHSLLTHPPTYQLSYKELKEIIHLDHVLSNSGYPTLEFVHAPISSSTESLFTPSSPIQCARCFETILFKELGSNPNACHYHYGFFLEPTSTFSCCDQTVDSMGCTLGPHIFVEKTKAHLNFLIPYLSTGERTKSSSIVAHPMPLHDILIMTAEVCYTNKGEELSRLCLLDKSGKKILDELIRPQGLILDLNTRVSGIQSLDNVTHTVLSIREEVLSLINADTILIGHHLHQCLNALRLIHTTVIDVAILFSYLNKDRRLALRELCMMYSNQPMPPVTDVRRDTYEDAKACFELVRYYLEQRRLDTCSFQ